MIKVQTNKDIITISGHANYANYGKDIVCAAVSSTIITTVEAISKINYQAVSIKEEKNKLTIFINKHDDITDKLIDNMLECLNEIAKQYPKNIQITNREE